MKIELKEEQKQGASSQKKDDAKIQKVKVTEDGDGKKETERD